MYLTPGCTKNLIQLGPLEAGASEGTAVEYILDVLYLAFLVKKWKVTGLNPVADQIFTLNFTW